MQYYLLRIRIIAFNDDNMMILPYVNRSFHANIIGGRERNEGRAQSKQRGREGRRKEGRKERRKEMRVCGRGGYRDPPHDSDREVSFVFHPRFD